MRNGSMSGEQHVTLGDGFQRTYTAAAQNKPPLKRNV